MKDCKKIHPLLSLHLERALSPREEKLVEKHLAFCITARREMEQYGRMRQALRGAPAPEPPPQLHGKIMAHLGLGAEPKPVRRLPWGRSPLLLAASLALVFFFINRYPEWKNDWKSPSVMENRQEDKVLQKTAAPMAPNLDLGRLKAKQEMPVRSKAVPKPQAFGMKDSEVQQFSSSSGASAKKARLDPDEEKNSTSPSAAADALAQKPNNEPAPPSAQAGAVAPAPPAAETASANFAPSQAETDLRRLKVSKEISSSSWKGTSGEEIEREELVTEEGTFSRYWGALQPGHTEPTVDFTQNAVILLFAGTRPNPGYSIHVSRLEEKQDQVEIHFQIQVPTEVTTQNIVQPWSATVIPKPAKPVTFIEDN